MGENARPRIRHRSFCGQHGSGRFYGGVGAGQLLLRAPMADKSKNNLRLYAFLELGIAAFASNFSP